MKKDFLLVIKPMTDVKGIELVDAICVCGCNLKFKKTPQSKQKYRSSLCEKMHGVIKRKKTHAWKTQNAFMIFG